MRKADLLMALMAHACEVTFANEENYEEIEGALWALWDSMLEGSIDLKRATRLQGITSVEVLQQAYRARDAVFHNEMDIIAEAFGHGEDPHRFGQEIYRIIHGEKSDDAYKVFELVVHMKMNYDGFLGQLAAIRDGRL